MLQGISLSQPSPNAKARQGRIRTALQKQADNIRLVNDARMNQSYTHIHSFRGCCSYHESRHVAMPIYSDACTKCVVLSSAPTSTEGLSVTSKDQL